MRACLLTEYNKPWELREVPDPEPSPGQVLIRVRASGLCGTDLYVHHGLFPWAPLPLALGHESAGDIVALGPGVTNLKVGDRVGVPWMQRGCNRCQRCQGGRFWLCDEVQQYTWMWLGGGNATYMKAWAEGCTLLPEGISYEDAAPTFCAGYAVYSGIKYADPRPGCRVAVIGIGGLGHMGVQYAKALGFETFAVTNNPERKKELMALGADDVVYAGDDVGKALWEVGGADVIVHTGHSGRLASQAVNGLRPEGTLVNVGNLDQPFQLAGGGAWDAWEQVMKFGRRVVGTSPRGRRDLIEALQFVASGKVKPRVELYPLEKANTALERLEKNQVRFRAVLQIPE